MIDIKQINTFDNVSFILDLVAFIIHAFLDGLVIVNDILSHTQIITDDSLRAVVDQ